jgi:hypothetical protein
MENSAKAYNKVTLNEAALDSYKPAMFVTPTSGAAAPVPEASTAPAASAASAASTASK